MFFWRGIISASFIVTLTSCGGGGDGGSTPPVSLPSSPAPTPAPTPTPTPPPRPTVSAVNGFGVLAEFRFYGNGIAGGVSLDGVFSRLGDRQGKYPGTAPFLSGTVFGDFNADYAEFEKTAFGIDSAGSLRFNARAPVDSLVISPLTSLLLGTNSETNLKEQLGITGSLFALSVDRSLTTFSPIDELSSADNVARADAERLLAHHIRATAVAVALNRTDGFFRNPSDGEIGYDVFESDYAALNEYLDTTPDQFIYTNTRMSQLLRAGIFPNAFVDYRDDVISAAAHIVNAYASAIGVRIADRETAARFQLGISGFLIPELEILYSENSAEAAAAALSITNQQILDQTARFNEQLPFDTNANFFPQPDFYLIPRGGQHVVPADGQGSIGRGPFNDNDVIVSTGITNGNHFIRGNSSVTSVDVPSINQAEISAVLNGDGTVTITPTVSFVGVTYFDYSVTHEVGDVGTGRVYIIVR